SFVLIMAPVDYDEISPAVQGRISAYRNMVTAHKYGRYSAPRQNYMRGDNNLTNNNVTSQAATSYTTRDPHFLWSSLSSVCEIWVIPTSMYFMENGETKFLMDSLMEDLTRWNCISQIQGIYVIPWAMVDSLATETTASGSGYAGNYNNDDIIHFPTAFQKMRDPFYDKYAPHCQKLYTHPYSYLRVETPSGNTKEFKYEDFYEVTHDSTKVAAFRTMTLFNGVLTPMLIPRKYKEYRAFADGTYNAFNQTSVDPQLACEFNMDERVEIDNIPAVAYMTDAYLTQLSSVYMANKAKTDDWALNRIAETAKAYDTSQTSQSLNIVSGWIGGGLNVAGSVAQAKGGKLGGLNEAVGVTNLFANSGSSAALMFAQTADFQSTLKEAQLYNGFNEIIGNTPKADEIAEKHFGMTKPAFANNVYHPGATGDPMYTMGNKLIDFRVTHVHLRETILMKYDEYFKTYGYNYAGMVDIPYLCRYTQNESSNDYLPHWEQVNGKYSTYVKTVDAHVTHAMLPVSQAIAGMFDNGVRMLRGEDLYV
ncbi:MAG: hypothetical protein IIX35_03625, partial [Paraprevotella sp.]|nr:hypothetical protein [Paraprevotella sp.]